jgi:hypothetical protein
MSPREAAESRLLGSNPAGAGKAAEHCPHADLWPSLPGVSDRRNVIRLRAPYNIYFPPSGLRSFGFRLRRGIPAFLAATASLLKALGEFLRPGTLTMVIIRGSPSDTR